MKKAIVLIVLATLLVGCSSKYEGKNAKEWFEEYDSVSDEKQSCKNDSEEYETQLNDCKSELDDVDIFDQDITESAKCVQKERSSNKELFTLVCDGEKESKRLNSCPSTIKMFLEDKNKTLNSNIANCIKPLFR